MARTPFTYDNSISTDVIQPQFTISRHRMNGPKESEKFNLEAHQFYYDINRLHDALSSIEIELAEAVMAILEDGSELDASFDLVDADAARVFEESIDVIVDRLDRIIGDVRWLGSVDRRGLFPSPSQFPSTDIFPLPSVD